MRVRSVTRKTSLLNHAVFSELRSANDMRRPKGYQDTAAGIAPGVEPIRVVAAFELEAAAAAGVGMPQEPRLGDKE